MHGEGSRRLIISQLWLFPSFSSVGALGDEGGGGPASSPGRVVADTAPLRLLHAGLSGGHPRRCGGCGL